MLDCAGRLVHAGKLTYACSFLGPVYYWVCRGSLALTFSLYPHLQHLTKYQISHIPIYQETESCNSGHDPIDNPGSESFLNRSP